MMAKVKAVAIVLVVAASSHGFTIPQRSTSARQPLLLCAKNDASVDVTTTSDHSRRHFFATVVTSASVGISILSSPSASNASGGATAGKYTTIPIAKRRYYGRVQEAVHEFLLMAPAVIKGDLTDPTVQDFFDVTKTVVVEGKKKDINGICTKKDGDCKSTDILTPGTMI
eukprot:CCRYP_007665-RA/>CCRYP_007665-RA protein AED:0.41 eAED:0.41 QI:168/1/1/1/0.5/0.66/3/761/169